MTYCRHIAALVLDLIVKAYNINLGLADVKSGKTSTDGASNTLYEKGAKL